MIPIDYTLIVCYTIHSDNSSVSMEVPYMLTKQANTSNTAEIILLDDFVPQDHLVRKLQKAMDFTFIYKYCESMYSKVGRPSIDPVILFKIAFINRIFGYNSMRRTMREVEVNLAYRWFLGIGVNDKVPHFSDFSANYKRKFSTPIEVVSDQGERQTKTIFELIFDEILMQAFQQNLIYPGHVYMDSTHIKANANKKKVTTEIVMEERRYYQGELEAEIDQECAKQGLKAPKAVEYSKKKQR